MRCTYCNHEKASRDRSGDNNVVGRTYPSLSFSRLAIDLVKPVKQVSIQWVFPGGRLIGWKVATNSVLYLKQTASSFFISPSVTQGSFSNEKKNAKTIWIPSYIALVQALTRDLSHHHWCVPRPAKQPGERKTSRNLVQTTTDWYPMLYFLSYSLSIVSSTNYGLRKYIGES